MTQITTNQQPQKNIIINKVEDYYLLYTPILLNIIIAMPLYFVISIVVAPMIGINNFLYKILFMIIIATISNPLFSKLKLGERITTKYINTLNKLFGIK